MAGMAVNCAPLSTWMALSIRQTRSCPLSLRHGNRRRKGRKRHYSRLTAEKDLTDTTPGGGLNMGCRHWAPRFVHWSGRDIFSSACGNSKALSSPHPKLGLVSWVPGKGRNKIPRTPSAFGEAFIILTKLETYKHVLKHIPSSRHPTNTP